VRQGFALAVLLAFVGAAHGQEDLVIDQSKVYVSEPAACEALEKQGFKAIWDSDEDDAFTALTFSEGILGYEFNCGFYDVKSRANTPVLFVDAVCELPGELYPDQLAIAPNGDTSIRVVSSAQNTLALLGQIEPEPDSPFPAGTTEYHRCDNLSEIPFD
jgi:hypothetical protein